MANLGGFQGWKAFQTAIHKSLELIPVFLKLFIHEVFRDALHPPGLRDLLKTSQKNTVGFGLKIGDAVKIAHCGEVFF